MSPFPFNPWLMTRMYRQKSPAGRPLAYGLLSDALWRDAGTAPHGTRSGVGPKAALELRRQRTRDEASEDTALPDLVVNAFREALDADGLRFLKHGSRTQAEQLAFAQDVHPDGHLSSAPAPVREQRRFEEDGTFDQARYFVGPDRILYERGDASAAPLAFRLRRGIENAVGGYDHLDVRKTLAAAESDAEGGDKSPSAAELANGPLPVAASADAMRDATAREIHRKENRWPLLTREADRRKSILGDTAGLLDIEDSPDADWSTPWYSAHGDGYRGVKRHDSRIEREAKRMGVDPDLVRAIMYVEYANGYGYGGPAQAAGSAGSLYPMNIRPKIWQGLAGEGADFNDSDVNVRAGVLLLKRIADRLSDPSVAKIATLYNSLAKDQVTDYGAQVARAYRDKLWTAADLP
jgi:soluble lytic murein transglycosylase-like protein